MRALRGLSRGFANPSEPHLLLDEARRGRRGPEEQMLHTRKQLPDGLRHAYFGGIADSRLAKLRLGLFPDFGSAANRLARVVIEGHLTLS